jgi:hypothetical protein
VRLVDLGEGRIIEVQVGVQKLNESAPRVEDVWTWWFNVSFLVEPRLRAPWWPMLEAREVMNATAAMEVEEYDVSFTGPVQPSFSFAGEQKGKYVTFLAESLHLVEALAQLNILVPGTTVDAAYESAKNAKRAFQRVADAVETYQRELGMKQDQLRDRTKEYQQSWSFREPRILQQLRDEIANYQGLLDSATANIPDLAHEVQDEGLKLVGLLKRPEGPRYMDRRQVEEMRLRDLRICSNRLKLCPRVANALRTHVWIKDLSLTHAVFAARLVMPAGYKFQSLSSAWTTFKRGSPSKAEIQAWVAKRVNEWVEFYSVLRERVTWVALFVKSPFDVVQWSQDSLVVHPVNVLHMVPKVVPYREFSVTFQTRRFIEGFFNSGAVTADSLAALYGGPVEDERTDPIVQMYVEDRE